MTWAFGGRDDLGSGVMQGLSSMWEETLDCLAAEGLLKEGTPLRETVLPVLMAARQPLSLSALGEITGQGEQLEEIMKPLLGLLLVVDGRVLWSQDSLKMAMEVPPCPYPAAPASAPDCSCWPPPLWLGFR